MLLSDKQIEVGLQITALARNRAAIVSRFVEGWAVAKLAEHYGVTRLAIEALIRQRLRKG